MDKKCRISSSLLLTCTPCHSINVMAKGHPNSQKLGGDWVGKTAAQYSWSPHSSHTSSWLVWWKITSDFASPYYFVYIEVTHGPLKRCSHNYILCLGQHNFFFFLFMYFILPLPIIVSNLALKRSVQLQCLPEVSLYS